MEGGEKMADLLIVDDDHDAVETLADLLSSEGHEVRIGHDGKEGLALVHARKPDLVILDVEMPLLTGPEMALLLFVHDMGLEKVPIMLCSGVLGLRSVAARVGTPYFLPKPFGLDAFFQLVARALVERTAPSPRLPTRSS
jgi:DNA-binding NtrC family response regulator